MQQYQTLWSILSLLSWTLCKNEVVWYIIRFGLGLS